MKFKRLEKQLRRELNEKGFKTNNGEFTTYRTILHEGDLPGDQGLEWWGPEDWARHAKHVEELKAKGTYGKPWVCELTLKYHPLFDNPSPSLSNRPMESYRFEIIDFSK